MIHVRHDVVGMDAAPRTQAPKLNVDPAKSILKSDAVRRYMCQSVALTARPGAYAVSPISNAYKVSICLEVCEYPETIILVQRRSSPLSECACLGAAGVVRWFAYKRRCAGK